MAFKSEEKAFEKIFKEYKNYIYVICYRYSGSVDDTLDLTQETFLKVFKAFHIFKKGNDILPWIRKIAINTCISYKRKVRPLSLSIDSEISGTFVKNTVADKANTEGTAIARYTAKRIEELIKTLPDKIRIVLILRQIYNMSYKEIAAITNHPEGTVKTYIYKGRNIIKDTLKNEDLLEV